MAIPEKLQTQVDKVEATHEIAYLLPAQGQWTVEEYLSLNTNRLVEFVQG
jgi:hypothetical protein